MPYKLRSPCRYPGCPNLCDKGCYCQEHQQFTADRRRGNASARGYDGAWRTAREQYLRKNPLCVECLREGKLTPATVVDHVVPHRGDPKLFWDKTNWQALCSGCHNRKTGCGL